MRGGTMIDVGSVVAVLPRNGELAVVTGFAPSGDPVLESVYDATYLGEYHGDDLEEVER